MPRHALPAALRGLALAALLAGSASRLPGRVPAYPTVPLPPGSMVLRLPLNPFLQTDFLALSVTVKPGLRMGAYEVSNRDWEDCFKAGGCGREAERRPGEGPDCPVARVNWMEAEQFADWLSRASGRRFRLPTEGEWYYAYALGKGYTLRSRGGFGIPGPPPVEDAALKRTRPLGSFGTNAWGVADMGGNVWDWTLSCYTLSSERLLNPAPSAALKEPDTCHTRVLGGRACASAPDFIRDDYAGGCGSGEPVANMGFRLVEEVAPSAAPTAAPTARALSGRFSLIQAADGREVTQASYDGRWRLVFFGYTHCPVLCPMGLNTLARTLRALGPDSERWRCLFITLDPDRDDAKTAAAYVRRFDPRIVGLTGSAQAVHAAMRAFHLDAERVGAGQDYQFDHPAILYVMAPDGSYRKTVPCYEDPATLAGELERLQRGRS